MGFEVISRKWLQSYSTIVIQSYSAEEFGFYLEEVINFCITTRILGILENVQEKSQDFILERDYKLC